MLSLSVGANHHYFFSNDIEVLVCHWCFRFIQPTCSYITWVIKGPGMSSPVVSVRLGRKKIPCHLSKREGSPSGGFPPSFIHQVIIITGLNTYDCMFSPWRWPQMSTGCKTSTHHYHTWMNSPMYTLTLVTNAHAYTRTSWTNQVLAFSYVHNI